jgi:hypothetical protein
VNTRELSQLQDWDEDELQEHVLRYVRAFRRFPTYEELVRFRRARNRLHLRIPRARSRRAVASVALRG